MDNQNVIRRLDLQYTLLANSSTPKKSHVYFYQKIPLNIKKFFSSVGIKAKNKNKHSKRSTQRLKMI